MRPTTKQLEVWQGEFGRAYTDRNVLDWRVRFPAFETMLAGLELSRVLEVGCNRGHNLETLVALLPKGTEILGVEPNSYALSLARSVSDKFSAVRGNIFDLPFKNDYFDLVFTAGVLIHISPDRLADGILEIARVSRRYILCIEYYADQETVVEYRGHSDLLWKRNYVEKYQTVVPDLHLLRSGEWKDNEHGFARCHWWLLEKGEQHERKQISA